MPDPALPDIPDNGRLADNITHFARALRRAGLPVGTGRVIDAVRAVEAAGFSRRQDFYWALHASFVSRPEHRVVFNQIFALFWRDPHYLEHMMSMLLPMVRGVQKERAAKPAQKRAAEALLDGAGHDLSQAGDTPQPPEIDIDTTATASPVERLRQLDFEQMSTEEMAEARRMLARISLPVRPIRTRRNKPDPLGHQPDWQATMRLSLRRGGEMTQLAMRKPRVRWPNLVVLCDISGSMSDYSRAVLHFVHAVANQKGAGWAQVHGFTFGTRLTNITRHLRHRDVDAALAAAGARAQDWAGGTRIAACLHAFNRDWSRRVLGSGAVVLLITDGLDRDDPDALSAEMQRLALSATRIIWVNPLLRWDGFAPKARGIAAMLPHVTSFRAGHNIASLEALAKAISQPDDGGEKERAMTMLRQL